MTSTTCTTTTSSVTPVTCTTTTSSVTPVTSTEKGSVPCIYECLSNPANTIFNWDNPPFDYQTLENRCQFPIGGLLIEVIQLIFMQCLSSGDLKGFTAFSRTNIHSFITMRKLVNEAPLTQLCSNLRILNAKTLTFHTDLRGIDRYKALQSYYKLEPFVEGHAGLTVIFNHGGLTLKGMKGNNCGVKVHVVGANISKELDNIPEKDTGPEMVSNAPITETRSKSPEVQETRVRDEVGFDGKPTLIQYLALLIATQKELKICLYGSKPGTYGRTSIQVADSRWAVGGSVLGGLTVCDGWDAKFHGAGGRKTLGVRKLVFP